MGNETETQTGFKLVGFKNFVRTNPKSDRFKIKRFHHVEFWCTDATNTARRFSWGLGMPIVAKSDLSTGNLKHASYLLRSGDLNLLFSAAYSPSISLSSPSSKASIPTFDATTCFSFSASHGLAVRAVAVEVDDVELAFTTSINNGAIPASPPVNLDNRGKLAEVRLYGDAILRYISYSNPNHSSNPNQNPNHCKLLKGIHGFHEFAEFTEEDVGTSESGLNSVALANNEETVLFPINEPVYGTKRKSQIETYLEHNEGAGVQHLALISEDIFKTLREMRKRSDVGGFEFMPSPPVTYYRNLKNRVGDVLSDEQIKECEELGILVDRDDQGTLLQIFTKPIGDRPTIFLEIIQRVGCMFKDEEGKEYQKGGCGGFGKGNFSELFKSVEEYEKSLEARRTA
ncbi:4-hydroxyphenylpyruvate dioxygenase [Trifolium repens]|nr:4-hydroxyphenylpyruvate dioxygenase [Trifolium repens]